MNDNNLPDYLKNYFNLSTEERELNKFANIKSASEKVDFCLQILREKNWDHVILQPDDLHKDEKQAESALHEAESLFAAEEFDQALVQLNKGLCFAPLDCDLFTQLYGLRARIYFNLGLHQQCLENVSLAIEGEDIPEELEKIRNKCVSALLNGVQNSATVGYNLEEVKLSYPAHPNIPFIAECIHLSVDKIYGRNLITDRDLRPGDVIMMEQPFAAVIDPSAYYTKCANCLSFNNLNLMPCPNSATAMFCSKMCRQEAEKKFHKHEWPISKRLKEWFNGETQVAFRLLVLALNTFGDIGEFESLSREVNRYVENQFTFDFKGPAEYTILKTLCSLTTVENNRSTEDLMKKAQITAVLYFLLKTNEDLNLEGYESFIKGILFQFIQATTINTFGLFSLPEMMSNKNLPQAEVSDFGISTYPLSSFLSHSCAPNVRKARAGNNHELMVIFVVRPIRAGERICDCYDQQNNHMNRSLEERRALLYSQYYFVCQCEACIHDYPQEKSLTNKLKSSEWNAISAGFTNVDSPEATQKNLEALSTFLNDFDQLYPCNEILIAQKYLHQNIRKLCTKPSFVYL